MRPEQIINKIIDQYKTIREFSVAISETPQDIWLWKNGKRLPHARAVVSIIKQHPEYTPHELNPDLFELGLSFNFNDKRKR